MPRLRTRKTIAVLGIVVVVFTAFTAWASPDALSAVLTPLWLVWPAVLVVLIRRRASRCDVQPVSLLSLLLSRAPPAAFALA